MNFGFKNVAVKNLKRFVNVKQGKTLRTLKRIY